MKTITPFGQQILDAILDVVVSGQGMGFIGWSIGGTKEITAHVARKLGRSQKSVDGGLAHLITQGFFSNDLKTDSEWIPVKGELAPTHEGWLAYSRWDEAKALAYNDLESLEDWELWDGVDGTFYPFQYDLPKWE